MPAFFVEALFDDARLGGRQQIDHLAEVEDGVLFKPRGQFDGRDGVGRVGQVLLGRPAAEKRVGIEQGLDIVHGSCRRWR